MQGSRFGVANENVKMLQTLPTTVNLKTLLTSTSRVRPLPACFALMPRPQSLYGGFDMQGPYRSDRCDGGCQMGTNTKFLHISGQFTSSILASRSPNPRFDLSVPSLSAVRAPVPTISGRGLPNGTALLPESWDINGTIQRACKVLRMLCAVIERRK
jgi:hypothetical protein